VRDSAALQ